MKYLKTAIVEDFSELLLESIKYAKKNKINKLLVFTKDGKAAVEAKKIINDNSFNVIAVTFPVNELQFRGSREGVESFIPETSNRETREKLIRNNIDIVSSTLPFDTVIVPGTSNDITNVIKTVIDSLFGKGIQLAIQGTLMATDNGAVRRGERIVSIVKDVAIDVVATNARLIFHPEYGLQVKNVIGKVKKLPE